MKLLSTRIPGNADCYFIHDEYEEYDDDEYEEHDDDDKYEDYDYNDNDYDEA